MLASGRSERNMGQLTFLTWQFIFGGAVCKLSLGGIRLARVFCRNDLGLRDTDDSLAGLG